MSKIQIGEKYNLLTALEDLGTDDCGTRWFKFKCDCGNIKQIRGHTVISGRSSSCGCFNGKWPSEQATWTQADQAVWNSHRAMKERCDNPNNSSYHNYGARGITYCEAWKDWRVFKRDMGYKPSPEYSLDRIDNNGNYEPSNCKWSTKKEQQQNRFSRYVKDRVTSSQT